MRRGRTRVLVAIGALAVLAVVAIALLVARSPSPDTRARPDADLVLAAVEQHQAVLDAEWTDPGASTGAASPMPAEEAIRYVRDGLIQDGLPVTSATSEVSLARATFQDDGTVLAAVSVSTTFVYSGHSESPAISTDRHWITLSGSDAIGYSVTQDEVIRQETASAPDEVQRRADLIGLAVSAVFGVLALVAALLPWLVRFRRPARPGPGRLTGLLTSLLVGGPAALAVALAWCFTVGGASAMSDFDGGQATCMGERITTLDSRLESYDAERLWHGCIAHSRIDVALALVAAVAVIVVEYLVLAGLRARTARSRRPAGADGSSKDAGSGVSGG